jgi:hypothetical protein
VFIAGGTYYLMQTTVQATEVNAAPGLERGLYTWNVSTGAFEVTTLNDTNGDAGLSDNNGVLNATLFVSGDTISQAPGGPAIATRIKAPANTPLNDTIVGGCVIGNPAVADSSFVVVFDADGTYYQAQDGPVEQAGRDGVEQGTYTWDPSGRTLVATSIAVDTNGDWGLSDPFGAATIQPSIDGLVAMAGDTSGLMPAYRVIDPNTVVPAITSPLSAAGNLGGPFSYTMTADKGAFSFGAAGLPAGLSIDGGTGIISGIPVALGSFNVSVTASNSLRTGSATLNIVVVSTVTTATGSNVTVTPVVPPGTPPLSVTFDSVGTAGATTVTVVDSGAAPAVPPDSGYSAGNPAIYYDISTTAVRPPGSVATLCFNYAGISFAGNTPRLLHFEGGAWKDITTSVDAATTTVCGATTSFSPFTIAGSPTPLITRTGFYSPLSSVPGFVNTAKGGSTVPLKFNVYVNGVEKEDTAGLQFSVASINCTPSAEDQVDYVTSDATSLRYDGQQFHQNWRTPKGTGCYIARITTADGRSLSANFKMKQRGVKAQADTARATALVALICV